jgi:hypothetical protein
LESSVVLVKWIRSKVSKPKEPAGKRCISCLKHIPGATEEELFFAGGVLLAGAGWFCGERCQNKYRLRFRVQPSKRSSGETTRAAPHSSKPSGSIPVTETNSSTEPVEPERAPAADVLAEALRSRRRRMNSGG